MTDQHEKYPDGVPKYQYKKEEWMVNHNTEPTEVLVRDDDDHTKFETWKIPRDNVVVIKSYDGFEIIYPAQNLCANSTNAVELFDPKIASMSEKVASNVFCVYDFSKDNEDCDPIMNEVNTGYLLERIMFSHFFQTKTEECKESYEEPVNEDDAEGLILIADFFDC